MDNPSSKLIIQRIRNRIIEHLEIQSSSSAQIEFQEKLPFIYLPYEMINSWEDYVRPECMSDFTQPFFTQEEQNAIITFNSVWERIADKLPDNYPPIEQVLNSDYWEELNIAAREALAVFHKRGKLSEDLEI